MGAGWNCNSSDGGHLDFRIQVYIYIYIVVQYSFLQSFHMKDAPGSRWVETAYWGRAVLESIMLTIIPPSSQQGLRLEVLETTS